MPCRCRCADHRWPSPDRHSPACSDWAGWPRWPRCPETQSLDPKALCRPAALGGPANPPAAPDRSMAPGCPPPATGGGWGSSAAPRPARAHLAPAPSTRRGRRRHRACSRRSARRCQEPEHRAAAPRRRPTAAAFRPGRCCETDALNPVGECSSIRPPNPAHGSAPPTQPPNR